MGRYTVTEFGRWVKRAGEKNLHAVRLNIGPRLMLCFAFITLSMLGGDAVVLWQFHLIRDQAERLNVMDQQLVAVLRVHKGLLTFHDKLEALARSEDAGRLVTEAEPLRTAVLEDTQRAMAALSLLPSELQRDPAIMPTLLTIQRALPPQLKAITTLATSGDWRAVRLRLANQVHPLESLTSALVEKVAYEAGEQQSQTVLNVKRVQQRVFLIVPMTAVLTLLIAGTLGLSITSSITRPLARLVEGSKALARGEFQHQVAISGEDELAHLGQVFNDTARHLRDLYATLQSSEDRLRRVIDTIPAHVWSALPDGSVDFICQRWLESTGLSVEDGLGWNWGSVVHPEDFGRFVAEWHAALAAGEPMESEARLRRADGDYRWWLIRNVPLRDELGNVIKWYGTSIDIEDRKRAEEKLQQSEAYLSEAQRLSHTGSFGWRASTGEILWSEETFRIFQYDKTTKPTVELILQRVHPEDAAFVKETIERASQHGKVLDFEHRLLMPDGSVKHVHVVGHALSDESGNIEFIGAVTDTTDSKRDEEALRRSGSNLAEAQRLTHTGSWAWRVAGRDVLHVSEEWYRIYGFDPEGGPPAWEERLRRVHPEDRAKWQGAIDRAIGEKSDYEVEFRILLPDGTVKYIHTVGHPVLNASGDLAEFVGSATDITDRKRAELLLAGEKRLLEMIARGDSRALILEGACLLVEELASGSLSSILLLDPSTNCLRHGAAPSLPTSYSKAIDGLVIGASVGSCGTAAYRAQPVIVSDIATDPLWADFRDLALAHELRACWSTPIVSSTGRVLGTFATYYREPRSPSSQEHNVIERIIHLASIAIERKQAEEKLRQSEAYLAEAQRMTRSGSWAWNVSTGAIFWSQEIFRIYDYNPGRITPTWSDILERVHPEDRAGVEQRAKIETTQRERADSEGDFRIVLPDGRIKYLHTIAHPVPDESGEITEVVGTVMDVTEQHQAQAALETAFEEIKALKDRLYNENIALREEIDRSSMFEEIVGESPALQAVLAHVVKVAPTDSTVLITGETGTGKELIARAIHKRSQRGARAFVSVNCAAIPPSLIASELFGHEKGAFTGAIQRRLGRFELAEGGTIFLDEIGELPLDTQIALLRVLQEREFERVGGGKAIRANVRVIAATNRDLQVSINAGTFRSDLYYRLNVFPIEMPPLRKRREDIPLLVEYFIDRYASKAGKKIRGISRATLDRLKSYFWPGNIRELQNVIERSVIVCETENFTVDESWLSRAPEETPQAGGPLSKMPASQEKQTIEAALAHAQGRVSGPAGAAAKLGIPPSTLDSKIKTFKINKHRFKTA